MNESIFDECRWRKINYIFFIFALSCKEWQGEEIKLVFLKKLKQIFFKNFYHFF